MVAARILKPQSKLATSRSWSSTTLADMIGIGEADEGELYEAMDWLLDDASGFEPVLPILFCWSFRLVLNSHWRLQSQVF